MIEQGEKNQQWKGETVKTSRLQREEMREKWRILIALLLGFLKAHASQNSQKVSFSSSWNGIKRTENLTIGFLASYVHTKVRNTPKMVL